MHKLHKMFILSILICLNLVGCKNQSNSYNGYIDADLVYLSSDFSGQLTNLLVTRGVAVSKKQLLFQLEQFNETRAIDSNWQTQNDLIAERGQIRSKLDYAKINYKRQKELYDHGVGSRDAVDQAHQNLDVLQYQVNSINAQIKNNEIVLQQKMWQRDRKQNIAPDVGIIYDTYFTVGEYVQGGQPVLSLITPNNIKAIFFVSESQLGQIKLNQKVKIHTDNSSKAPTLVGNINYISNRAEYTPPIIYSKEERQKLVFKIELRLENSDLNQIHLGQPVTIEL